ncbi:MAG: hypothetical protein A2651_01570 [Candidatus Yanofskybacteria bacterium RIFCSPHIGHO2_01_FULL_42_12]|uniref:Uncharacterized protein n=1 Tax=Candidatus Yanofskybacteria bacterium RIFCSPLOWO2_01_FULL_42_49 TaxID=1802694 RepID=A0A1F8GB18_9BACT|nr:MAG: hypothetical protein A2651_01570 [Candidatus Yanofskybacteria bacterium RIFCSPHIGHO2_01_FULL_42_12]OGN22230.1 MAG: hypothetical protein A2918_02480 [Candidatus Yanofskybacteria bacterium RIFCSPLOWO2_01_FULL_42_49]
MFLTFVLFLMISVQAIAYLWFQSKGGLVSHKKFILVNLFLMVGQSAQSIESFIKEAYASFAIASFFFLMTAVGAIKRYIIMKKDV